MKKSVLFIMMLFTISLTASAQKFALIDMERSEEHTSELQSRE